MNDNPLKAGFQQQSFANGYELVDGVEMNRANGEQFQIPHPVLKKHLELGFFVELRIDSPRFSVHEDAAEKCTCPSCNGEMSKPILRHDHPATLVPLPPQNVPSRGWGEDFWAQIIDEQQGWFVGRVDNPLVESRLHEVTQGDVILFHADHVLAIHPSHRAAMVSHMDVADIRQLVQWLDRQS